MLLFLLGVMSSLKFSGASDQMLGQEIISVLIEDRKSIYFRSCSELSYT